MSKVYACFFLGQGGYWFSMPVVGIADTARSQGFTVDVFTYTDYAKAESEIQAWSKFGYKIALIGYSLGVTSATYLQSFLKVDLLISIAASTLGDNHVINHTNTKRSVLFRGTDFLSSAGLHDGYDEVIPITAGLGIPVLSHLLVPTVDTVSNGVLNELVKLKGT
jgi:hypothetical protein